MRSIASVALLLLLDTLGTSAHHSYAGFETTPVTLAVQVESLTIANPHALIYARGNDGHRYVVVWPAPNGLVRQGFVLEGPGSVRELLPPGQRLTVTGRLKREDEATAVLPLTIEHPVRGRIWER